MRYRVERERLDHGYGFGWVILDEHGDVQGRRLTQPTAFTAALLLATVATCS